MRAYLQFLKRHPAWWITPIALYVATIVWLAAQVVRTPENPFAYSLY